VPIRSMETVGEPRILSAAAPPGATTQSTLPRTSQRVMDLTVVIPAADEEPNLALLMPQIVAVLDSLRIAWEILVVLPAGNAEAAQEGWPPAVRILRQERRGYGGALLRGFSEAKGRYVLTMDADLSHPPAFIRTLWEARESAEVTIASRYVTGGTAEMPLTRRVLSRILNTFFSRGLSLQLHDMSSGFRLYKAAVLENRNTPRSISTFCSGSSYRLTRKGGVFARCRSLMHPGNTAPRTLESCGSAWRTCAPSGRSGSCGTRFWRRTTTIAPTTAPSGCSVTGSAVAISM